MPNREPAQKLKDYPISPYPQRTRRREHAGLSKPNGETKGLKSGQLKLFHEALDFQIKQHGDTSSSLIAAIAAGNRNRQLGTLKDWRSGRSTPRRKGSMKLLRKIERHYRLPDGYFAKLIAESNPTYKRNTKCQPNAFQTELNYLMHMHGDSSCSLASAISRRGEPFRGTTLTHWKTGKCLPRKRSSFPLLEKIELHYGLPVGHLAELLAKPEAATKRALRNVNPSLRGVFCWHLPDDFEQRPQHEQTEIVEWIKSNVVGSTTEYGRFQSKATQNGFSIVFPTMGALRGRASKGEVIRNAAAIGKAGGYGTIAAPATLAAEMENLFAFKTALLPPAGYRRHLRWCKACWHSCSALRTYVRCAGRSTHVASGWSGCPDQKADLWPFSVSGDLGLVFALARAQARLLHKW